MLHKHFSKYRKCTLWSDICRFQSRAHSAVSNYNYIVVTKCLDGTESQLPVAPLAHNLCGTHWARVSSLGTGQLTEHGTEEPVEKGHRIATCLTCNEGMTQVSQFGEAPERRSVRMESI